MSRTTAEFSKPLKGNGAWVEYVKRKRERSNYTCRIDGQGNVTYFQGSVILTEKEFNEMLPIGLINRSAFENLDSRKDYY